MTDDVNADKVAAARKRIRELEEERDAIDQEIWFLEVEAGIRKIGDFEPLRLAEMPQTFGPAGFAVEVQFGDAIEAGAAK